jgi:metallopeptidase MepB
MLQFRITFKRSITSTMAPKKYRQPPQAPPSFTATPASLLECARSLCGTTRTLLDKIAAEITPETATFENVILPIVENEDKSALQDKIITFYQVVSGDSYLRIASSQAEQIMDEFKIEVSARQDIFKLVDTVHKKGAKLDPESQRLLEKTWKTYIANGLGIPAGPQRDRFEKIKMRLSEIKIAFQRNLNEEHGGMLFTEKELEGVPSNVLSGLDICHQAKEAKKRLTFKYADLHPMLQFALNADVRRRVFIENENKVGQAPLWCDACSCF